MLANLKARICTVILFSLPLLTTANTPDQAYNPKGVHTVYQFPNETWVENIAVRANGNLLVTLLSKPELYEIEPTGATTPKLVARIPRVLGLFGITELTSDVFAVVAGNFSVTGSPDPEEANTPGSYSVWKVNITRAKPIVTKIADFPESGFLNGAATLPDKRTVLVADGGAGVIRRVDTVTGAHTVAINDTLLGPSPGVDGVRYLEGNIYFTSTDRQVFGKVSVNATGFPKAPAVVISKPGYCDDFAITSSGVAYAASLSNSILKITPDGKFITIAGSINSTVLEGATSAAFGRRATDKKILYVTTNGGIFSPVNGYIEGGKIVAINTSITG